MLTIKGFENVNTRRRNSHLKGIATPILKGSNEKEGSGRCIKLNF
jgi:hypothetical protein